MRSSPVFCSPSNVHDSRKVVHTVSESACKAVNRKINCNISMMGGARSRPQPAAGSSSCRRCSSPHPSIGDIQKLLNYWLDCTMTMIEFIEAHLGTITLALTIATVWMAISTRNAALASKQIFALEARPFLVFSKPVFRIYIKISRESKAVDSRTVKLGLEFRNPSRVPVTYEVKSLRMTMDGRTVENPHFNTHGSIVYPNEHAIFWYGEIPVTDDPTPPIRGVIEYQLEYLSTDHLGRYKKSQKMNYELTSFDPYSCDWSYLEDDVDSAI
jgi:hypothetical protein